MRAIGCLSLVLWGLLGAQPALAQEWARRMFPETNYNFGVVARGAKTEHRFPFSNLYLEDVHIAGVRASCGCTTPIVTRDTLKTYEQAEIIAHFNTDRFLGQHGATLTVVLDRPQPAEVQLRVDGYIRSDVVVTPGQVELGSIPQGTPIDRSVTIDYSGRPDWQIVGIRSSDPHVQARVNEVGRQGESTSYKLIVHLDENAPPGYLADQLTLVTNDYRATEFPVVVEGRVLPQLSASPSTLFLGVVPAGQRVTRQLVVQAQKPFRITSIRCEDPSFTFRPSSEAKTVHVIPVTFTAGAKSGQIAQKIHIETDLGGAASADLSAFAEVPALAGK
jgi:uncharacterized protein DUF1573